MDLYWFWPYLRREELALAGGVLRPGDTLSVHATPRPDDPLTSQWDACALLPPLAGVAARSEGTLRWASSRATTYLERVRQRRRALAQRPYDVAHVVYLNPFVDWWDLDRVRRRVPLVSSVHDVAPHQRRMPSALEHRLLARQYAVAGTLLVHHPSVATGLVERFDVDPARIRVIPLPVLPPPAGVGSSTRSGPPTVLFFGTFRRNKGLDVLLDAIERTRGSLDARFVIAGRGFADVEARVRAAAAGDPRISAEVGFVPGPRKAELHAAADLLVLPYTSFASQSAVLADAFAYGLPVVVTDVGALGETVRAEQSGVVVPPSDVDALARAMVDELTDADARRRHRDAALAVAAARTPAIVGGRLRALYDEVAGA